MKSIPEQIFESVAPHERESKLREWIRENPREAKAEFDRCRRLQSGPRCPAAGSHSPAVIPPEGLR